MRKKLSIPTLLDAVPRLFYLFIKKYLLSIAVNGEYSVTWYF